MPTVLSEGVEIYYEDTEGTGPAIVLVHGFASGLAVNWRFSGWIDALSATGRRVIALDCRGHGKSGKPQEPAAYAGGVMSRDVIAVMDACAVELADVMGYSMGGTIVLGLLAHPGGRFRSAVLGGFGLHDPATVDQERFAFADALIAPDAPSSFDPGIAGFRRYLEQSGQDVAALAAVMRGQSMNEDEALIKTASMPVLLAVGAQDEALPGARRLAGLLSNATITVIGGASHMTAVGAPEFRETVMTFLQRWSPVSGSPPS